MANIVLMPQIGISEESAILARWLVAKGGAVKAGDKLFVLETGKSAFEVESEFSGTVLELLAPEGDELLIQAPVCVIGEPGESYSVPQTGESAAEPAPQTAASPQTAAKPAARADVNTEHAGVSPRARMLAESAGANPLLATPTGPESRIIERDVRALLESGLHGVQIEKAEAPAVVAAPSSEDYEDKPLTHMRKLISKAMHESLQNTAQLTHTASFDATCVLEYRKQLKNDERFASVTLTDMVLYAVTRTLPGFPALNAWLTGDTMRCFKQVNLACAVDTGRGLMVPVIFGASQKSLLDISNELKALASACRAGSIAPELLSGGSFTVSNLGAYGIESFTPILNAPQTGILGVNTITHRVRQSGDVYPCMTLSLTYDHRALDGAPASAFLKALCGNLERFTALLAKG